MIKTATHPGNFDRIALKRLTALSEHHPDAYAMPQGEKTFYNHEDRNQDRSDFYPATVSINTGYRFNEETGKSEIIGRRHKMGDDFYGAICADIEDAPRLAYGDAWEGVALHTLDMTQSQRQILEDCNNGSGGIQRQGLNVPNIGAARKIEKLAADISFNKGPACTLDDAENLLDFWAIIDDSQRLWSEFKTWTRKKGTAAALKYFETLAGALVDDDCATNDAPMGNDRPNWESENDTADGDIDGETGEEIILNDLADLESVERAWAELTTQKKSDFNTDRFFALVERFHNIEPTEQDETAELFGAFLDRYTFNGHLDRGFAAPPVFRYENFTPDLDATEKSFAPAWKIAETAPALAMPLPSACKLKRRPALKSGKRAPVAKSRPRLAYLSNRFYCYRGAFNYIPVACRKAKADKAIDFINSAKLAELKKLKFQLFRNKARLAWIEKPQTDRIWDALNERTANLEILRDKYVTDLMANLTPIEKRSLTEMRNTKSVAQAKFYWSRIYAALEGKVDMGRKGFVEYVLKPELNARQDFLKANPAPQAQAPDFYDDPAYLESLTA